MKKRFLSPDEGAVNHLDHLYSRGNFLVSVTPDSLVADDGIDSYLCVTENVFLVKRQNGAFSIVNLATLPKRKVIFVCNLWNQLVRCELISPS